MLFLATAAITKSPSMWVPSSLTSATNSCPSQFFPKSNNLSSQTICRSPTQTEITSNSQTFRCAFGIKQQLKGSGVFLFQDVFGASSYRSPLYKRTSLMRVSTILLFTSGRLWCKFLPFSSLHEDVFGASSYRSPLYIRSSLVRVPTVLLFTSRHYCCGSYEFPVYIKTLLPGVSTNSSLHQDAAAVTSYDSPLYITSFFFLMSQKT
ncbi:hypothetical protein PoB_003736100 [Plakobranchus ocellatus]|uniref:Uncharacterized protein n=1 Tax=Plakobranchus ocellatus TaxID=259542 RepID=A0AAV4AI56_9GAST|nr:hypothetical protein PoB_003736100 [Plakobranchus ocellatus]